MIQKTLIDVLVRVILVRFVTHNIRMIIHSLSPLTMLKMSQHVKVLSTTVRFDGFELTIQFVCFIDAIRCLTSKFQETHSSQISWEYFNAEPYPHFLLCHRLLRSKEITMNHHSLHKTETRWIDGLQCIYDIILHTEYISLVLETNSRNKHSVLSVLRSHNNHSASLVAYRVEILL